MSDPTLNDVRDIAARIWRDHYLGGDEDNDLGPIDDTDRQDADAVIAELASHGIRLAALTPPEPSLAALSTPPSSLDRLRAIEYEAESWHDAIRRGDFGPSTCACNRMDGTRCSLGAALEGAPDE